MSRRFTNRKRWSVRIVLVGLTAVMVCTVLYSEFNTWTYESSQQRESVGFLWTSTQKAVASSWTFVQEVVDSSWTSTQKITDSTMRTSTREATDSTTWTSTREAMDSTTWTSTREATDSTWTSTKKAMDSPWTSTAAISTGDNRQATTANQTKVTSFLNEAKKVESPNKHLIDSHRPPIFILMWRPLYKDLGRVESGMKQHCPKHNCRVTTDRKYMPEADAVVFEIEKMYNLPTKTKLGQVWVYVEMESPALWGNGIKTWTNLFNWTMTYRRDSDITHFYGSLTKKNQEVNRTLSPDLFLNKTGRMLWLVSNCHTPGKRETFAKELQKYIAVDVVGRCGKSICPKRSNCETSVMENYKFYFAAENSNCRDYVTEKAYRPFGHYILPVGRGGGNYSIYFPPKSYINTDKFKSKKLLGSYRYLGNHLHFIDKHEKIFESFISVTEQYRAEYLYNQMGIPFCKLCDRLHNQSKFRRLYRSIHDWWRGKEQTSGYFCKKDELARL